MPPIPTLDRELIKIVADALAPIPRARQEAFLELFDDFLADGDTLNPAAVRVACARAQREILNAPAPADGEPPQPPSLRSPYQRRAR